MKTIGGLDPNTVERLKSVKQIEEKKNMDDVLVLLLDLYEGRKQAAVGPSEPKKVKGKEGKKRAVTTFPHEGWTFDKMVTNPDMFLYFTAITVEQAKNVVARLKETVFFPLFFFLFLKIPPVTITSHLLLS